MRMSLKLIHKTGNMKMFLEDISIKFGSSKCLKIVNQEEISNLLTKEELMDLVKLIHEKDLSSNFELLLSDIDGIELKDSNFEYDNFRKKAFLYLTKYNSIEKLPVFDNKVIANQRRVEKYEKLFNKNVLDFSDTEQNQMILGLYDDTKAYYTVKTSIVRNLVEYEKIMTNDRNWRRFIHVSEFMKVLSEEKSVSVIKKDELYKLFKYIYSPQSAIIQLLLFEGVKMSKHDDLEEMRFLKEYDLHKDRLDIRNEFDEIIRSISIEQDTYHFIKEAINFEGYYTHSKSGNPVEITFYGDYILKRSLSNGKLVGRKDVNMDDPVAYITCVKRSNDCREELDTMGFDYNMSPRDIRDAGKLYYANKLLDKGLELKEVAKIVGERFGDLQGKDAVFESSYRARLRERLTVTRES